jgi:hypothetical protein
MNVVYSPDCKGQIIVSYALYVVAIARGALHRLCRRIFEQYYLGTVPGHAPGQ